MFETLLATVNGFVWGPVMLVLILGTGIYLMLGLRFMPLSKLGFGFRAMFAGVKGRGEGDITPFAAQMTALSATIGTGNIVGVATAVGVGGPGALFWMWCTALVGMATKYAECMLAVHFRETDELGQKVGGPMYYIRAGLGKRWAWLAFLFALFGTLAGFGIGSSVQSNSVASAIETAFAVPPWVSGLVMAVMVGLVLLGGIKRIGAVSETLVPLMVIIYLSSSLIVLAVHIADIPAAFLLVVKSAFTPVSAAGGFAGATIMLAIEKGVARGIFSNEAGLGSAPIAHAAAETNSPVDQGAIAMTGTFIDTIIVCTLTGLMLVVTGVWNGTEAGVDLTSAAMSQVIPHGDKIVAVCLSLFAFTTMLGWSYYGERCAEYLMGVRVIVPFRILWVAAVFTGAVLHLDLVWMLADTLNGLMAMPNLVALLLLGPLVFRLTRKYFDPDPGPSGT
ncbi:MAG: sodium:alanine symporter family protein [Porticoccaceae bacterium]|nr:sodium:alanine symporter family protein [Porticoccaceae bacterium]